MKNRSGAKINVTGKTGFNGAGREGK